MKKNPPENRQVGAPPRFALLDRANTITHPEMSAALKKLRAAIAPSDDSRIVFFIAPTGCGKSHVARCLVEMLESEFSNRMKKDLAFLPAALVELSLRAGGKQFNWTEFYERLLAALKHPFPESRDLGDARTKLETVLADRGTLVVLVDEAHHVIDGYSDEGIRSQSEVLKSLSQSFKVVWVYIGTYDLNPLVRFNGQLARRSNVIHMGRYRNTPNDRATFRAILETLDKKLRPHLDFCLAEHDEVIYNGCLGLVGVLRDWLVRARENSSRENEAAISLEALGDEEKDLLSRITIIEEAKNGEKELEVTQDDIARFTALLEESDEKRGSTEASVPQDTARRRKPHRVSRMAKRFKTGPAA